MPPKIEPSPLFREALKAKRRGLTPQQRKKRPNLNGVKWLYPQRQEDKYRIYLQQIMAQFSRSAMPVINRNMGRWMREGLDRTYEAMINDLRKLRSALLSARGRENLTRNLNDIYSQVDQFNRRQWGKVQRTMINHAIFLEEPWSSPLKESWVASQITFIEKITSDYINMIQTEITQAAQTTEAVMDVKQRIKSKNRSQVVTRTARAARIGVARLNGLFTKNRQLQAGITKYIWITERDERVTGNPQGVYPNALPSHFLLDQKICKWTDDKVWSLDGKKFTKRSAKAYVGIPGQRAQCRCEGMPWTNDMILEVDEELRQQQKLAA